MSSWHSLKLISFCFHFLTYPAICEHQQDVRFLSQYDLLAIPTTLSFVPYWQPMYSWERGCFRFFWTFLCFRCFCCLAWSGDRLLGFLELISTKPSMNYTKWIVSCIAILNLHFPQAENFMRNRGSRNRILLSHNSSEVVPQ